MKRLLLLIVSVLLIANGAWAESFEISGSVNASEIPAKAGVVLTGNTTIFMDVNKEVWYIENKNMSKDYSLTINGGNILTVRGLEMAKTGISSGDITINAPVDINTLGTCIRSFKTLTINANVTVHSLGDKLDAGTAILADNGVVINSGNVVLQGAPNREESHGIKCKAGSIDIKGGTVVITAEAKNSYGMWASNNITIDANVTMSADIGIYAAYDVEIKGGSTSVVSKGDAVYGTNITINNANVTATGYSVNGIEAIKKVTINGSTVKVRVGIKGGMHYGIHSNNGDIDITGSSVDINVKGADTSGVYAKGGTIHLSKCSIYLPIGGSVSVSGSNIVDYYGVKSGKVYIDRPSISGSVALANTPIVGEQVDITLSGEVATVSDLSYQWQISNDGTSWSDISGATNSSYTPKGSDYEKYIRVRVQSSGMNGSLTTASRKVEKKLNTGAVVAPTLAIENNQVCVTNAVTSQEYLIMNWQKAINNLTESDWSGSVKPSSNGKLALGGTMNKMNFVYTRKKATDSYLPGTLVEYGYIYLGDGTSYIEGISMTLRLVEKIGSEYIFSPLNERENGAYYVKLGDAVEITVSQLPSTATFSGIATSKWINNSGGGAFYSNHQCTLPLEPGQNYKKVYYKPTQQKNKNEIVAEYTRGYNDILTDRFYLHVANESGYVLMDRIDPVNVTLGTGETLTGIDLITHPGKASVSDLNILIADADGLSSPPPYPTLTFNKETRKLTIDATGVHEGTYRFSVYQGGTKMSNRITVNVTGVPCEGILFDPAFIEMEPGETVTVAPQLQPANTTVPVTWTSSSSDVTVSDGTVTVSSSAPRGKTYTIKAEAGGFHADLDIYVPKLPAELAFGSYEPLVYVGDAFTPPTLENPHGLTVGYSSSDTDVATVNATTGEVTIVGEGVVKITASASSNSEYAGDDISYDIVVEKRPADLSYAETTASAKIGETFTAPTLTNPNNLTVSYSSSDATVATVNATTGEVTLLKSGTTTITATFAGNSAYAAGSASYDLTVAKGEATLDFSEAAPTAKIGETFTAPTLTKNPDNLTVTFASSDATVATVNAQTGEVTLVKSGSTTISASFAGDDKYEPANASYILTIDKGNVELAFTPTETLAKIGETFTAPTLTNPKSLPVSYASSVETVATVNPSTGVVTLVASGSTTISASFAGNDLYEATEATYYLVVDKGDAGIGFPVADASAKMGDPFTAPKLTNPKNLEVSYTSNDESVATVNPSTGEVTLVAAGVTVITASFAGNDQYNSAEASYTLTVNKHDAVANGLAISASEAKAKMGESFTPPTLTNPNDLTVVWKSSDESVAWVDSSTGDVVLQKSGVATISATFEGNDDFMSGTVWYTLIVEQGDAGLLFSETTATAKIGEGYSTPDLTNPNGLSLTWTSSDESVATVYDNGDLTILKSGVTTITATFAGDDIYAAQSISYTLTIEKGDAGLSFSDTEGTGKLDGGYTAPDLMNPNNLTLTWTSSDESVATIDVSSGSLMLLKPGVTTITATFSGDDLYTAQSVSYTLTVEKGDVYLLFLETEAAAKIGEDFYPPLLDNHNGVPVTWTSSDETVATVDETGNVTLVAPGVTTITATFAGNDLYNADAASYTLTVNKQDVVDNGLYFSITEATAKMGEPFTTPTLTNPYNLTVTWKSSDESVATVDAETGVVTLVGPGTTTIKAIFAGDDTYMSGTASYNLTVEGEQGGGGGQGGEGGEGGGGQGQGGEDAILGVQSDADAQATWYDLRGRKLSGKPQQSGIYIKDGRKVTVK